ncbi:tRNA 2-thiocytidine(32) synthetase TtcA [Marinicellulosiphila megalodicopiae]|uniref:tRNA 2-thiocytidine(32) synthetase TtcA n=1 Tax=Marinicellulosiphila megalodicopiae TaxID=2724896 RepID=UPI003BAFBA4B
MTERLSKKDQINMNKLRKRLRRETGRAIVDYNMIEEGDKVMVCLSGGKDSYTMLAILNDLQRSAPVNFELIAVNLDQKQPGYPEHILPEYLKSINQPYHIIERDTYSVVKDTVPEGKTTCGICSRLRRSTLYAIANEIGATKIALGHHRDDIIETLFLNMFNGGKLKAMPPKLRSDSGRNVLIRPLAYCKEKDIEQYSIAKKFPIIPCNLCGTQEGLQRQSIKAMIKQWDKDYPGRSDVIFKSIQNVSPSQLADGELFDFKSLAVNAIATAPEQNHALSPLANIKLNSWVPELEGESEEVEEIVEDWSASSADEVNSVVGKSKVQVFEP